MLCVSPAAMAVTSAYMCVCACVFACVLPYTWGSVCTTDGGNRVDGDHGMGDHSDGVQRIVRVGAHVRAGVLECVYVHKGMFTRVCEVIYVDILICARPCV